MDTFISNSLEETQALGRRWGGEARAGWLFALFGDLGSGKTELVKGLANAWGVRRVRSPTFGLVHEHAGQAFPFYHLDLYRLTGSEEVRQAGLEDYFYDREGVVVVEWAERWYETETTLRRQAVALGKRIRRVQFELVDDTTRRIQYEDFGA